MNLDLDNKKQIDEITKGIKELIRFLKQRDTIKKLEYLLWKLDNNRELNAQELSFIEKEEKEFWDYVLKNN